MPPSDSSAPAPTPIPEPPKKQGFFAKLFGGKKASAPAVPGSHESQTPPPQLDETVDNSVIAPTPSLSDPVAPATTEETAAPSSAGEELPPTVAVPPAVEATPAPENDGVAPTLSAEPPAPSEEETTPPTVPPAGPTPPVA